MLDAAVDPEIEKLARKLVETSGANPDLLVQNGSPQVYGTSTGMAFAVDPSLARPLWSFYTDAATVALTLARTQLGMSANV